MQKKSSFDIKYTKFELLNGLKCILYNRKDIHSVYIAVEVKTGSLDETEENNGLSHFIEHLPFDGTEDLSTWEEVDRFNNEISGSSNAYTTLTHTQYFGYYPNQYLDKALYYISQLVLHPLHKLEDVNKEREIILDEMQKQNDSIGHKIYRNIIENRFNSNKTPYTFDIIGEKHNLEKFTQVDVKKHFQDNYVPSNMEIYIVGNFDEPECRKLIEKYFYDDIKSNQYLQKPKKKYYDEYPEYSKFSINARQKKDIDQYYLTLTFPMCEFKFTSQKQRLLVPFLKHVTASSQYQQSVLWKKLREELGIVYGVSCMDHDIFSRAFLTIQTSFSPNHLETVINEIHKGINQIKKGEFTDSIFKSRQKRLVDTQLMSFDQADNVMNWIIDQEYEKEFHESFLTPIQFIDLIKSYKFEDIIKTANEIYDWDKANIGIVSQDDPKQVEEKVKQMWKNLQ